ncbi:MAG: TetR/AcrR family transcriptional regulator [Solirubrobacteraceae bacterium]|nr:TetR/AcrR family transcriptional regulator [Solirubrobacteraceae bacterium]
MPEPTSAEPAPPARRPYGGVSHEQRKERRRQQFLDAGLELFGTIGYRQTTVRVLAKQAGATDRYFYESFANMEDLLVAVYGACMDRVQRAVLASLEALPPRCDEAQLIATTLDAFFLEFEDRRLARVCWIEILGVSPNVDAVYQGEVRRFADFLAALVRERFPDLMPPEHLTGLVSIALIGAVSETAIQWFLDDYERPREHIVAALVTVFLGVAQPRPGEPSST